LSLVLKISDAELLKISTVFPKRSYDARKQTSEHHFVYYHLMVTLRSESQTLKRLANDARYRPAPTHGLIPVAKAPEGLASAMGLVLGQCACLLR